jgi:hypothetical protein
MKNIFDKLITYLIGGVVVLWFAYFLLTGGMPPKAFIRMLAAWWQSGQGKYMVFLLYYMAGGVAIWWWMCRQSKLRGEKRGDLISIKAADFVVPFIAFILGLLFLIKIISPCNNFLCITERPYLMEPYIDTDY